MTTQTWISSSIACAALFGVALLAQDNPPQARAATPDITGLPPARGIYYHAADEWVSLPFTILMPFNEGQAPLMEVVDVWADRAVAELPGPHAGIQIGNDTRPIFYLHGIAPNDLYLVRAVGKTDYREIRMPISAQFRKWAHFHAKDVADLEIQPLGGDVVSVRPRADLQPGEYALASVVEPGDRWIRLGYDFGVVGRIGQ